MSIQIVLTHTEGDFSHLVSASAYRRVSSEFVEVVHAFALLLPPRVLLRRLFLLRPTAILSVRQRSRSFSAKHFSQLSFWVTASVCISFWGSCKQFQKVGQVAASFKPHSLRPRDHGIHLESHFNLASVSPVVNYQTVSWVMNGHDI